MLFNRRTIRVPASLKTSLKIMGYASVIALVGVGVSYATLDDQVEKASTIVFGNVAKLVVGGGTLFGGAYAAIQGNIGKAMAILGTGGITGIGLALASSGNMFQLLK